MLPSFLWPTMFYGHVPIRSRLALQNKFHCTCYPLLSTTMLFNSLLFRVNEPSVTMLMGMPRRDWKIRVLCNTREEYVWDLNTAVIHVSEINPGPHYRLIRPSDLSLDPFDPWIHWNVNCTLDVVQCMRKTGTRTEIPEKWETFDIASYARKTSSESTRCSRNIGCFDCSTSGPYKCMYKQKRLQTTAAWSRIPGPRSMSALNSILIELTFLNKEPKYW